ncbi:MAG: hypothetical protein AABY22_30260, partial [Nanoarchaeota archaeon]
METIYITSEPQQYLRGDGTIWNPIDCSTRDKFDLFMSGLGTNTFVNLLPGTYYTRGRQQSGNARAYEFQPKSGWKIHGAGIGQTKIILDIKSSDTTNVDSNYAIFTTKSGENHSDIEIKNITFDLNLTGISQNLAVGAIHLAGDRNRINNCEVINWGNKATNVESFIFRLDAFRHRFPLGERTGDWQIIEKNIIHKPKQTSVSAGGCTCIASFGETSGASPNHISTKNGMVLIKENLIDGTIIGKDENYSVQDVKGISINSVIDADISRNVFSNIKIGGPYQRAFQNHNISVENNKYYNCMFGPYFLLGEYSPFYDLLDGGTQEAFSKIKELYVLDNTFLLSTGNAPLGFYPTGIVMNSMGRSFIQDSGNNLIRFGFICERFICRDNNFSWFKKGDRHFCQIITN